MWYLDSSAFLKLVIKEPETMALRAWFEDRSGFWSSQLLHTEVVRTGEVLRVPDAAIQAGLAVISLMMPSANTFYVAARLAPTSLRSLEALHLAAALELGGDLEGIVTYDRRMTEGALSLSMNVIAPR